MFFMIGAYPKEKIIPYKYDHAAVHSCGKFIKIEIIRVSYVFSLFFIPIFNFGKKYYVRFNCCGKIHELDKETGKKIERGENPPIDIDLEQNTIIDSEYEIIKSCPQCGKTLEQDFEFCPYCGKKL